MEESYGLSESGGGGGFGFTVRGEVKRDGFDFNGESEGDQQGTGV